MYVCVCLIYLNWTLELILTSSAITKNLKILYIYSNYTMIIILKFYYATHKKSIV